MAPKGSDRGAFLLEGRQPSNHPRGKCLVKALVTLSPCHPWNEDKKTDPLSRVQRIIRHFQHARRKPVNSKQQKQDDPDYAPVKSQYAQMNSPDNERNNEGAIVAKILKIPILPNN